MTTTGAVYSVPFFSVTFLTSPPSSTFSIRAKGFTWQPNPLAWRSMVCDSSRPVVCSTPG